MTYVDGFVIPVPKKQLAAYKKISTKAGRIWKEFGALDYKECVGDDLKVKWGTPFLKLAKAKPGETVVFSWITYKSKAQRDRINKKVMNDPRLKMDGQSMPFDMKRMTYGGFKVFVDA
jgi:uncharacterized protein YbaA (DUF1428 family)